MKMRTEIGGADDGWSSVFYIKPLFIQVMEYHLNHQYWKIKDSFITDFSFLCNWVHLGSTQWGFLSSEGTKLLLSDYLNLCYPQDGSIGQDREFSCSSDLLLTFSGRLICVFPKPSAIC